MIIFRPFKTAEANRNRKVFISTHAMLTLETTGQKLRVSIPAVRKPANIRSAAR